MTEWRIAYTRRARKDIETLRRSPLRSKARDLLDLLRTDPFASPPPYESLRGEFVGAYSRRINIQHRLVYQVDHDLRLVRVISMWTHYE